MTIFQGFDCEHVALRCQNKNFQGELFATLAGAKVVSQYQRLRDEGAGRSAPSSFN
ncbi:hypothetical protein BH10PLA2_BH10PLA2_03840 [soil metagenome]